MAERQIQQEELKQKKAVKQYSTKELDRSVVKECARQKQKMRETYDMRPFMMQKLLNPRILEWPAIERLKMADLQNDVQMISERDPTTCRMMERLKSRT